MPRHFEECDAGTEGFQFGLVDFAIALLAAHLSGGRQRGELRKRVLGSEAGDSRGSIVAPVEPQVRALHHPVALQPAVVDVVEIVSGGLDGSGDVHQVEVRVAGSGKDAEAAILGEGQQEGRHHWIGAGRRDYGADIEEAVMAGVPLVEADHDIRGERHRMIEKSDGGHMRAAGEGIERDVADLEAAAPGGGEAGVGAPATVFCQGDGGIERFPAGSAGRQIRLAPTGIVGQIARTLLHHGVEQEQRGGCRDGILAAPGQFAPQRVEADGGQQDQEDLRPADDAVQLHIRGHAEDGEQRSPELPAEEDEGPERRAPQGESVSGAGGEAPAQIPHVECGTGHRQEGEYGHAAVIQQFPGEAPFQYVTGAEGIPFPGRLPTAVIDVRSVQQQRHQLKGREQQGRCPHHGQATEANAERHGGIRHHCQETHRDGAHVAVDQMGEKGEPEQRAGDCQVTAAPDGAKGEAQGDEQ